MKLALGSDHAGFEMKNRLRDQLRAAGHQISDFGTDSEESTDYPDYARAVSQAVANGQAERGILVCGSGAGMQIAANKIAGIRAASGYNAEQVRLIRAHNDANVLTLGARFVGPGDADEMVEAFLHTPFEGGRHQRRVQKIGDLESGK